jgi:hypothetical protein
MESNPQPSPLDKATNDARIGRADVFQAAELAVPEPDAASHGDQWPVTPEALAADGGLADAAGELASDVPGPEDAAEGKLPLDSTDGQEAPDSKDTACQPTCEGKECGDNGCGGSCGDCEDGGCCVGGLCGPCGGLVEIEPTCVNVPFIVGAGAKFPIAVFSSGVDCAKFDHAETKVEGNDVTVTLFGQDPGGVCPPCVFYTLGMVWIDGLPPGPYNVKVGKNLPAQYLVASAGDLPEPQCQEDCVTPMDGQWDTTYSAVNPAVETSCSYGNLSGGATFYEGDDCNHLKVMLDDPKAMPIPNPVLLLCTEQDVFVGLADEFYDYSLSGTRCKDPWGPGGPVKEMLLFSSDIPELGAVMGIYEKW